MSLLLMRGSPLRSILSTPGLMACYLPYMQVAQSLTGQSLIDYSPQGNDAQLGSTAGADTNDPSWGTNALTFGGDDHCVTPDLGGGDITAFTVFRMNTTISGVFPGIWSRNNVAIYYHHSTNSVTMVYRTTSNTSELIVSAMAHPRDTWGIASVRLGVTAKIRAGSLTGVGTLVATSVGNDPDATKTSYSNYLGRWYVYPGEGDIACHVLFNRVLSDDEASRVRANIVTLMNGQGVTVA